MVHNFVMIFKKELFLSAEETIDIILELSVLQTSTLFLKTVSFFQFWGFFPIYGFQCRGCLTPCNKYSLCFRHLRGQQLSFLYLPWLEMGWLICKVSHFCLVDSSKFLYYRFHWLMINICLCKRDSVFGENSQTWATLNGLFVPE